MRQPSGAGRPFPQVTHSQRVPRHNLRNEFQRHRLVQHFIVRPPDHAHPAKAHPGLQRVAAKHFPAGDQHLDRRPQIFFGGGYRRLDPGHVVVSHGCTITPGTSVQFNVKSPQTVSDDRRPLIPTLPAEARDGKNNAVPRGAGRLLPLWGSPATRRLKLDSSPVRLPAACRKAAIPGAPGSSVTGFRRDSHCLIASGGPPGAASPASPHPPCPTLLKKPLDPPPTPRQR